MANAPVSGSPPTSPTCGPVSAPVSSSAVCPGCGKGVDPLRAGHVAILEGRFRYFCRPECKQEYLRSRGKPPEEDVPTARPPEVAVDPLPSVQPSSRARPRFPTPEPPPAREPASISRPTLPSPEVPLVATVEPDPMPARRSSPALQPRRERSFAAVDAAGIALGALAPAVALLGPGAEVVRLPLVVGSWLALVTRLLMTRRDPADPHPLSVAIPTGGAVLAAGWAAVVHDAHAGSIAVLAGLSSAVAVAVELLVARARARMNAARERIESALDVRARVVRAGDDALSVPAAEVRPGEQVVVEAGETAGVDATIVAGEARVVPFFGAQIEVVKREGDPIVAGARVLSSRLRLTTTWSGRERAWVKLLSSPAGRIDVASPTPRMLRLTVERGAPIAALVLGLAAFGANATPVQIAAAMCAGAIAFGARAATAFVALHFARAHLEALTCGITYKDPPAFERAGAANVAVLSARGTVLQGEPEIVVIEPLGAASVERVLALAAGAETASTHPFAAAVLRAARTRDVSADHVRNATVHAGLGVTASASDGERLVVGGRGIMLEEKVGVALADARISELEAQGRSVLLVALGDRLIGLIALMDGLRPGARAAVQKLLDAHIEPVLLSGEARDTCETIARALDIEHVRPEVLPADRGPEVRALAEGGSVVAVVGHPQRDDGALGSADVAIAMGAAGSTPGEWAVALATDDVRDAAAALAIPHHARERARAAIVLGAAPGIAVTLAIGFGIASPALAPLGVLMGALAVAVQARDSAAD